MDTACIHVWSWPRLLHGVVVAVAVALHHATTSCMHVLHCVVLLQSPLLFKTLLNASREIGLLRQRKYNPLLFAAVDKVGVQCVGATCSIRPAVDVYMASRVIMRRMLASHAFRNMMCTGIIKFIRMFRFFLTCVCCAL